MIIPTVNNFWLSTDQVEVQNFVFSKQVNYILNTDLEFLGAVVKNPPANAGDTGSSPGPGRSHTPRSN